MACQCHKSVVVDEVLDRRLGRRNLERFSNLPILDRHIEINSKKHFFTFQILLREIFKKLHSFAVISTIFLNSSARRLAPPTTAPESSGRERISCVFSPFTLAPYSILKLEA